MVYGHLDEAPAQARRMQVALRNESPFRITHVFLDVDGTLVDSKGATLAAEGALANHCATLADHPISVQEVVQFREVVSDESRWRGAAPNALRYEMVRRLLAQYDVTNEVAIQGALAAFSDARTSALRVFPDVHESLAALRALGVVLIAASNGNVDLERVGLAEYVDDTHYACNVGVSKPDPRFFALALLRFNVPACSALAVGDRVDNDYEPSRAAGLYSVLLDRLQQVTDPSITRITALSQLPALLSGSDGGLSTA